MTAIDLMLILLAGSLLAGFLGALSGLGGGLVIVPLLTLGLGVDIHYAIGTSLVAVIATSTASSCAFIKEGFTNIRLGILLETATTVGAIIGVAVASYFSSSMLSFIFGCFLFYCAITSWYPVHSSPDFPSDRLAMAFNLPSVYPTSKGWQPYPVHRVPIGYLMMGVAGALSGILGIGSGALKVVALDRVMGLPFKVSTTTSNFMIGVTAATSAGLYLKLGYIDPVLTIPVVVGVSCGSFLGARLLPHIHTKTLRQVFACLVAIIGIQMVSKLF